MDSQRKRPPEGGPGSLGGDVSGNRNHTTTAPADALLPRLDKVRETGPGQWLACCPAHEDRTPSLSIKQTDDRLLVHCFAGCPASDVVAALGLSLADLFDKPLDHHRAPLSRHKRRRNGQAFEALQSLRVEALVTLIAADRMAAGHRLGWRDTDRLHTAFERILEGCKVVGANPKDAKFPGHPPELNRPSEYADQIADYNRRVNRGEVPA